MKLRKKFLELHPFCKAHLSGCMLRATDVHHPFGRGGDHYLKVEEWIPLCRACHKFVEENPLIAKELGLSHDRLTR